MLYTALERECCGLLRFRTRDRLRVLGVGCPCGREGARVHCIGRTDDMLIVLGVNVFPTAIRDLVEELHPRTTGAMQVVLAQSGRGSIPRYWSRPSTGSTQAISACSRPSSKLGSERGSRLPRKCGWFRPRRSRARR